MNENVKAISLAIATLVGVAAFVVVIGGAFAGLGQPVSESTFTGQPVDVEFESGVVFETSSVELKTGEHSDETETFCIYPSDSTAVDELRNATAEQQTVTVTYERPLYVGVWKCGSLQPILTEFEVSGK